MTTMAEKHHTTIEYILLFDSSSLDEENMNTWKNQKWVKELREIRLLHKPSSRIKMEDAQSVKEMLRMSSLCRIK